MVNSAFCISEIIRLIHVIAITTDDCEDFEIIAALNFTGKKSNGFLSGQNGCGRLSLSPQMQVNAIRNLAVRLGSPCYLFPFPTDMSV